MEHQYYFHKMYTPWNINRISMEPDHANIDLCVQMSKYVSGNKMGMYLAQYTRVYDIKHGLKS